eukprot:scaffold23226_cov69-Skeletonema_menzelii.AAC.1
MPPGGSSPPVDIFTEGVTDGEKTEAEEMDATDAAEEKRRELLVATDDPAMDRPPPPPVGAPP